MRVETIFRGLPCRRSLTPCVSPSRTPVLSFAFYFQAPATQAKETTKGLHDSYTILTLIEHQPNWTVLYSILYLDSSSVVLHMLAFGTRSREWECPYPDVQGEAPDSNPDGRALEAEPDGLEEEDLRWVLVRVDLTNWEIRLIYLIFMLWHYWLYISGIWRWTDSFISEYLC